MKKRFFVHFFAVVLHYKNVKIPSYQLFLWRELSYVLTKNFVACALVRFYFFTAAHFHLADRSLLAASTSHFLTAAMKFHVFLPTKFVSLVFNLFFCYLRKCRHETEVNNVGKDSTLLMFFSLLKSEWQCDSQKTSSCIWVAIPVG